MRILLIVPQQTKVFWFHVVARVLTHNHPDAIVLKPADDRFQAILEHAHVVVEDPPPPPPPLPPEPWWRKWQWWRATTIPAWDPMEACDVVMILWNGSSDLHEIRKRANVLGKKVWFITMK